KGRPGGANADGMRQALKSEAREGIWEEISESVRAMSARHGAELRAASALTVPGVVPFEALVFRSFAAMMATGIRPACAFCGKPVGRVGDTICSRSNCRKRAARATLVEQLPIPPPSRGRPPVAHIRVQREPDDGWGGVSVRYRTSKFRNFDPLPRRTVECRDGRHKACAVHERSGGVCPC